MPANNIANASTTGYQNRKKLYYTAVEAERKGKTDKQNLVAGVLTSGSIDFNIGFDSGKQEKVWI